MVVVVVVVVFFRPRRRQQQRGRRQRQQQLSIFPTNGFWGFCPVLPRPAPPRCMSFAPGPQLSLRGSSTSSSSTTTNTNTTSTKNGSGGEEARGTEGEDAPPPAFTRVVALEGKAVGGRKRKRGEIETDQMKEDAASVAGSAQSDAKRHKVDELDKKIAEMVDDIKAKGAEIEAKGNKIAEISKEITGYTKSLLQPGANAEAIKAVVSELKEERTKLEAQQTELKAQQAELKDQQEELKKQRDDAKKQRDQAQASSSRSAAAAAVSAPGATSSSPALTAAQVAQQHLSSATSLHWPSLDAVKLQPASVPDTNAHAGKLKAAASAAAVPGTTKYTALLDRLVAPGQPISKGMRISEFEGASGSMCVVLLGPSGSGKTRKALELLREKGGLFLSYRDANDKNLGSWALTRVLNARRLVERMAHVEWTTVAVQGVDAGVSSVFTKRRDAIHFAVKCVLAAYGFVYSAWLAELKSHSHLRKPTEIPHTKWLLAQLFPVEFFGVDIFETLALDLFTKLSPLDPQAFSNGDMPRGPFVIDEAQVFGKALENMFNTQQNRASPRPLLSAVISGVREATGLFPIICGTGLSLATEFKPITSAMATSDMARFVFHDFPPLDKTEVRALMVRLLACENDPHLDEACEWLVGRPRWTTNFIERALEENRTVSQLLPEYVQQMTDPEERIFRGPAFFIKQVALKPGELTVRGTRVTNPYESLLMDAYWVSLGLPDRLARSPALIEIGIGYAQPVPKREEDEPGVDARVKAEALVLEAARRFRALLPQAGAESLLDVQDSDAELGKRFEYVAAERVLASLLKGPLEANPLLGGIEAALPAAFQGEWEMPAWRCGKWALAGAEAFPDDVLKAVDPRAAVLRVWFPDNHAGPDVWALVRSADGTRVMLILIQVKLAAKVGVADALLTVDPAKL